MIKRKFLRETESFCTVLVVGDDLAFEKRKKVMHTFGFPWDRRGYFNKTVLVNETVVKRVRLVPEDWDDNE